MAAPHTQSIKDHRRLITAQIEEIGADGASVKISEQELLHLLHMRAIGFGLLEITVVHGKPSMCKRVEERIDYTKPIDINPE